MATPRIKHAAVLIEYDPAGNCVYSEILSLDDYYDGEHLWDTAAKVKRLKLRRLKGYLFDSAGRIEQEFESVFNIRTGLYASGQARFADGTVQTCP